MRKIECVHVQFLYVFNFFPFVCTHLKSILKREKKIKVILKKLILQKLSFTYLQN